MSRHISFYFSGTTILLNIAFFACQTYHSWWLIMDKKLITVPLLIGFIFAVIYAMFPTAMLTADGLYYAWHIENVPIEYSIHPHHLLWLGMMHHLYNLIHAVIPGLSALAFMQFVNAAIGGTCVFLLIRIAKKLSGNNSVAIITGLFFGLSWGMIHFSTDANIYILVLFLILFCADCLFCSKAIEVKRIFVIVLLMISATLLHQVALLFMPAVLLAIWLKSPIRRRLLILTTSILAYIAVVLLVYFIAFRFVANVCLPDSSVDFISWLGAYSEQSQYWTFLSQGIISGQDAFQRSQAFLFIHLQDALSVYFAQEYNESKFHSFIYFFFLWWLRSLSSVKSGI